MIVRGEEQWAVSPLLWVAARLAFCDEFANCGNQLLGNLHDGLRRVLKRCFILRERLCFGLLLVMGEHLANALFIPASREFALLHLLPFQRRRRR